MITKICERGMDKIIENYRSTDDITKKVILITSGVIKQMSDLNKLDSNDDTNVESNLNVNA